MQYLVRIRWFVAKKMHFFITRVRVLAHHHLARTRARSIVMKYVSVMCSSLCQVSIWGPL